VSSREWDAVTYDRVSDPQFAWAVELIDRLSLAGDDVVLDAGCGSGRVTALLADKVPAGRLYAVDVSSSMVEHAREALDGRATVLCQDLVELELPEPVDAAFSNATFHWIPDHDALFGRLFAVLKPGGQLVAQCGGFGNVDAFRQAAESVADEEPFDQFFVDWRKPWNYATEEVTAGRLERAGFTEVSCWLEPRSVSPAEPRAFVSTVCLVRHLDPLPAELRDPFIDRVLARAGEPLVLDYVRLNMTARKPTSG
jgi:trans-aconitate 2-methyltransferase